MLKLDWRRNSKILFGIPYENIVQWKRRKHEYAPLRVWHVCVRMKRFALQLLKDLLLRRHRRRPQERGPVAPGRVSLEAGRGEGEASAGEENPARR